MPLNVKEFLGETEHLSATETGIYIRLMLHCWQHGSIPNDNRKLALIAHVSAKLWRQYRDLLPQFFVPVTGTGPPKGDPDWVHTKVLSGLLRYREISNKRKVSALQKHSKSRANAHAIAMQVTPLKEIKKDSLLDRAEEQQNYPTGESTFLTMRGVASRGGGAAPGGAPPPRPPQPKPNGNGAHLQASSELVAIMRRNGHAREKGLGDE
jgi:uncharacterized protein YdaU (DUF1376 family)